MELKQPSARQARRLAIFVHDLSATGVVRNAMRIAAHMSQAGWKVQLLVCDQNGVMAEAKGRFEVLPLLHRDRPKSRRQELTAVIPALRHHLRTTQPDILLSAGNHAHFTCWAATRGMERPRRVYRISNDLSHGMGNTRRRLTSLPRRLLIKRLTRDAARLVLVSPSLLGTPELDQARCDGRLAIIRNGIDVAHARTAMEAPLACPCWPDDGALVALGIGRMVPQKNFPTLLHAVALANRVEKLHLILLGIGSPRQRQELVDLASRLGIAPLVHFAGVLANPFPALRRASVFILPSFWEGSPNALLEAMACGTAVIASRTAGNAVEILDSGRFGVLVDPDDAGDMAQALLLQCDPMKRILPSNRAEYFDSKESMVLYEQVFQNVIDEQQP